MKRTLLIFALTATVFLTACASATKNRETQDALMTELHKKDFKSARSHVKRKDFYKAQNSKLLKLMEQGTVLYLAGDFYQASKVFEEARKTSDDLFTESVSRKIGAAVGSSSSDNYYGSRYERSLLRFYESLTHYNLYKKGEYEVYEETDENDVATQIAAKVLTDSERKEHLSQARSILLDWDTLLGSYSSELAGSPAYKTDLVQKLYGAFIHEEFGTSEEKQIALQLYKDAKDILLKNYNLYPSFNEKSNEFSKDFDKLAAMSLEQVEKEYVKATPSATALIVFVDERIKKLSSNNTDNLTVVLKDGHVTPKKAKKVVIGLLPTSKAKEGDIFLTELSGVTALLTEAMGGDLNEFIAWILVGGVIEFEIPYVDDDKNIKDYLAEVKDKDGNVVKSFNIVLLDPVTNIAAKEFSANQMRRITVAATKFSLEHAAALVAAYQLWKAAPKDNIIMEKAAKFATVGAYRGAAAVINRANMADLRYWSSLAGNVRIGSVKIPDGEYKLVISVEAEGNKNIVHEKDIIVQGNSFVDANI
jgi:hypothetical protein